jgi:TPR repeat protein
MDRSSDFEKARKYDKIAAQTGDASFQSKFALPYGNGTEVPKDMVESAKSHRIGLDKRCTGEPFLAMDPSKKLESTMEKAYGLYQKCWTLRPGPQNRTRGRFHSSPI